MSSPIVRMYVDENGHQSLKGDLTNNSKRFLCITGIIMPIKEHDVLEVKVNALKVDCFGTTDIVLHRREIIGAKPPFEVLSDIEKRETFNNAFLNIVESTRYRVISIVIDKYRLVEKYGIRAQDPYALALEYLMQRYQYWMQEYKRRYGFCCGDMLAESRGGSEDRTTKSTYRTIYEGKGYNCLKNAPSFFSSHDIKLKPKKANIAGLQFADLISHAARRYILSQNGLADGIKKSSFEAEIVKILVASKFRRRNGQIDGNGAVYFGPK